MNGNSNCIPTVDLYISVQPHKTFRPSYPSDTKRESYEICGMNSTKTAKIYPTVTLEAPEGEYYIVCSLCEPPTVKLSKLPLSPHLLIRSDQEYKHRPICEKMQKSDEGKFTFELKNYFIVLTRKDRVKILISKYEELEKCIQQTERLDNTKREHISNKANTQISLERQKAQPGTKDGCISLCLSFMVFTKPAGGTHLQSIVGPLPSNTFVNETQCGQKRKQRNATTPERSNTSNMILRSSVQQ